MAKYVQLTADLARAAIDANVTRDLLVALEYIALAERVDAPYGEVKRSFANVAKANIELHLDDLIGTLLAERARTRRKRSNEGKIAKVRPVTNIREEKGTEEKRPVAPSGLPGLSENEFSRFVPADQKRRA